MSTSTIKTQAVPCVEVLTSKTGKHGHAKCHFIAIDIFNGKKLQDIVPFSHNYDICTSFHTCILIKVLMVPLRIYIDFFIR
ncbi:hypothetical protein LUZ61_010374 [Rhynchospora tenuis]|uniref:Translation initiation factor 5A-like N-terminal domain-containing protein n=1 Tax=Rhynchospora tenuis TaxID=198213 RepID=A0AAD5ZZ03_9POAL|nr:hypothetical protein LUZ61_010374 [Rhynchospora tenuis]